MTVRKASGPRETDQDWTWTRETNVKLPGRRYALLPGRELKVKGQRGKLYFKEVVTTGQGQEWLTAFDKNGAARSFRLEDVTWVSRNLPKR